MRLSTRLHGILDYGLGLFLVAAPWALGFASTPAATAAAVAVGAALILNALVAQHELALVRRVQLPLHLWIDGILGLLLALSPWLASFDGTVWAPHLAGGLAIVVLALITNTIPGYDRRQARTRSAP